jgi:hypothetical protein
MWKISCRKSQNFQGLSTVKRQNPHVINICSVECVEKQVVYNKLSFSVIYRISLVCSIFDAFLQSFFSA